MVLGTAALLWLLAATGDGAQYRHVPAADTDDTVAVARGARLSVENASGSVEVHTWDRDSLRVQARHGAGTKVVIRADQSSVTVHAISPDGHAGSVEYEITAPAWIPMRIEGNHNNVTIEGAHGDVSVENVRGDIAITKDAGSITASTIEGQVTIEGGRGKIDVSSVNDGINITGSSGEISAETTNGSISLSRIDGTAIDVATINGDVTFDGTIADNGRYSFNSHNGDIILTIADTVNATFNVRTYNGEFNTSLPMKGPERSTVRRGRRASFTLGTGSADVDLESFGGEITVRRPGGEKKERRQ
jgi:DUF4097 and DUF4098 domain-containing protein YvlB